MKQLVPLRTLRLLYVDEEPEAQEEVGDWLQGAFAETLIARSGAEALACLERTPVQALMISIQLPDTHGVDLALQVRAQQWGLPVVFTSATIDPDDMLMAMRLAPIDYLLKPIEWVRLKEALQRLASHVAENSAFFVRLGGGGGYICPRKAWCNARVKTCA